MKTTKGKLALITGASAGIGKELAKIHASKGGDLVLVARRKDRLEEIKSEFEKEYNIKVYTIAKDLSNSEAPAEIIKELHEHNLVVDYLINNAGFSQVGYFHELDWDIEESMIMVNVMALVKLTRLLLPDMVKRNQGKVLNVASSAAFAPGGPLQSIYFATKAFIVSFSRGIAGELVDTGITVTALCPGATETEFEKVSGLDKTPLFTKEKVFQAKGVAEDGYVAMLRGDLVKMTALSAGNKFLLKNMSLFPAKRVLQQIKSRQE
jgi:hypothetical protein